MRSATAVLLLSIGCTARGGAGGFGPVGTTDSGTPPGGDAITPGGDALTPGDDVPGGTDVVVTPGDVPAGVDSVVVTPDDVPAGVDVVVGPSCGNGVCAKGETCMTCPQDCGACAPRCGDGMCNNGETCMTCPQDCGGCAPRCGDSMCNNGETCMTCAQDCGACEPRCGDTTCNGAETCTTCPTDCGPCPTGCTATACGSCAENASCGWCRTTSTCVARSGSACADLVTSPTSCTVTPPSNITTACASGVATTASNDCGFRLAQTYTCTPGATVTFGCTGGFGDAGVCGFNGGACVGDPVVRVCAGSTSTGCVFASRIQPSNPGAGTQPADDDACGLCPWVRVTCPAAGSVSVFTRAYDVTRTATCTLARM